MVFDAFIQAKARRYFKSKSFDFCRSSKATRKSKNIRMLNITQEIILPSPVSDSAALISKTENALLKKKNK